MPLLLSHPPLAEHRRNLIGMAATVDFGDGAPSAAAATHDTTHLMPCRIALNGTSDVPMYFYSETGPDETKSGAFRGRGLRGQVLECGEHFDGYVLENACTALNDWKALQGVESFTHWSRDVDPASQTVGVRKLLNEWPQITACLSTPVTEGEIAEQMRLLEERRGAAAVP